MDKTKFVLDEKDMPSAWYNIQADLPEPLPPLLHPGTKEPTILPPPLFVEALNEQEFSKERWIEIPEEVQAIYKTWRPTALHTSWGSLVPFLNLCAVTLILATFTSRFVFPMISLEGAGRHRPSAGYVSTGQAALRQQAAVDGVHGAAGQRPRLCPAPDRRARRKRDEGPCDDAP